MGERERIRASISEVGSRSEKLVQLHVELYKAELRERAREFGGAFGMLAAGGLLAFFALGFALATVTVLLALVLQLWLSLLIVTVALSLTITALVVAGRSRLQRVRKTKVQPLAEAVAEVKTTVAAIEGEAGPATADRLEAASPARRAESLATKKPKAPARSAAEITKDIDGERQAFASAVDSIGGELQRVADAAARDIATGRKVVDVVPAVVVAAGTIVAADALLRRRRRRTR